MKSIKFYLNLLFTTLLFTNISQAQDWVRQHPFDIVSRLNDVEVTAEGFGWAVGSDCSILYTENNGNSWILQETPDTEYPLRSIAYVEGSNGQKAFAGGNIFYRTDNGGQTWEQVFTGISLLSILDIDVLSQDVIIVSASGGMARSDDGGDTWAELGDFSGVLNASDWIDLQTGYTITSEAVYKTTDAGMVWDSIFGMPDQFFHSIEFVNSAIGYLQGSKNTFKTTDAGLNWTMVNTESLPFSSNDLHVFNENELFVSYNNGGTLGAKSTNGGVSWTSLATDNFSGRSYGIYANDLGLWIVGAIARIGFSTDGGDTFVDQIPGNKNNLIRCRFIDDQVGYVVGNNGTLLKTTDGGQIWEEKLIAGGITDYINDVAVLDANRIWVAGFDEIYRSEDGGDTWDANIVDPLPKLMYVLSENVLFYIGSNGSVWRSSNNGNTWENVYDEFFPQALDIEFVNDQIGWITGMSGSLLKTTNGGLNWIFIDGPTSNNLGGIQFLDENNGYLTQTTYGDTLWKTTDGGSNWSPVLIGTNTFWRTIAFQDANNGWIMGGSSGSGRIYHTSDGGQNWELSHSDVTSFADGALPVPGQGTLWAVGFGGNIMKLAPCSDIPNLTMLDGTSSACEGDTINLEVIGTDVAQYNWEIPNDWLIFGNSNSALIQVIVGAQNGTVSIQGSNTCENSNTLTLEVTSNPIPNTPEISFDGSTLSSSAIADSYQWYFEGNPISESPSFDPQNNGLYSLEVTTNGCSSEPSETLNVILTHTEQIEQELIQFFPNPNNGVFQIQNIAFSPEMRLIMNDVSGRIVYDIPFQNQSLDMGHLNPGLYVVQIKSTDKIYIGKLMIK